MADNLGDAADEYIAEEVKLYMDVQWAPFASAFAFIVFTLILVFLLPESREAIIDCLIIVTSGTLLFYVVPTLHRMRRMFLFSWVDKTQRDKNKDTSD